MPYSRNPFPNFPKKVLATCIVAGLASNIANAQQVADDPDDRSAHIFTRMAAGICDSAGFVYTSQDGRSGRKVNRRKGLPRGWRPAPAVPKRLIRRDQASAM